MAYFAPFIDATGIHLPSYSDIRDQLISDAHNIFGPDIYLGIDSQDYQWISAFSSIIYDSFLTSQAVYNSRGPSTAIGSPLDIIVKLNGIKRMAAIHSTCYVTLTGSPAATITDGIVSDVNNISWALTTPITLGVTGIAVALATCQTAGPIVANPGEINKIVTPTYGWTGVTNAVSAAMGANAETDAQLRARQAISTAQPSRTVLEGLKGAIAGVSGTTRFRVYENDTNATDSNGLPQHSVTVVAEGGSTNGIALAISNKKGLGCYTNGDISVAITDAFGVSTIIRFYRPTYIDIDVALKVKALPGYTTQTTDDIKTALADYNNSLVIGDDLTISSLWGAALTANDVPSKPLFSITELTAAKHGLTLGTADIVIAFNQVTRGDFANIAVTLI